MSKEDITMAASSQKSRQIAHYIFKPETLSRNLRKCDDILGRVFIVLAENNVTVQAIAHADKQDSYCKGDINFGEEVEENRQRKLVESTETKLHIICLHKHC